jgi:hypothetical protein
MCLRLWVKELYLKKWPWQHSGGLGDKFPLMVGDGQPAVKPDLVQSCCGTRYVSSMESLQGFVYGDDPGFHPAEDSGEMF